MNRHPNMEYLRQHCQRVACVNVEVVQQRRDLLVALGNLRTTMESVNREANKLAANNAKNCSDKMLCTGTQLHLLARKHILAVVVGKVTQLLNTQQHDCHTD